MNGPTLADDFIPSRPLRPAMLQTILASRKIRMRGQGPLLEAAREVILESGDGVRLQGFHSPHPEAGGAGTVVLIHGWEGSAESAYVMCASRHLFDRGFSVFRLNLRDHGDTHHMNEGLFYATLIPETLRAVQGVAERIDGAPLYLVGFSMGGSFVLRVGLACAGSPIPGLRHIVAVSPVIHPEKSTVAIDAAPLIKWYFLKKWRRSLKKKQERFPARYDFTPALARRTLRGVSEVLIDRYSDFSSLADYFAAYTLTGSALRDLEAPHTIITARDDPVIPVEDFYDLKLNKAGRLIIHRFGGHSGFIEDLSLEAWHERRLAGLFNGSDSEALP